MARSLSAALVAVALAGCASFGANKAALMPQKQARDAGAYAATATLSAAQVDPQAWPLKDWWTQFNDPALDALIADALRDNPSLDAAGARMRKAQAMADVLRAATRPPLNALSASTNYQRLSENFYIPPPYGGSWEWLNDARITGTYTFDLWGKNRAAVDALVGQTRAASVDLLAAELTLTTSIVRGYVQLARASDQLDLANATLDARQKVLELARNRVAAGLDSQVDLKQAEAAVPAAREQIAALREAVDLARNQLAALAGRGPDVGAAIPRPRPAAITARAILPTALPAELIGRRPDVIAPRLRVEAALRDVESAKAAFYPNVELTWFAGFQSLGLSNFFDGGSAVAGIGPAVTLPVFASGRLRGTLAGKSADADAAVAAYQVAVVTALQEIADELASMRSVAAQTTEQAAAVKVLQESYDLALLRFKEGLGTYLQVLTAETQLLAQKTLAADLRARDLDLTVSLVRSLGGGFDALSDGSRVSALMPRPVTRVSATEAKP